jgi:hypothetical protein
LPVPWAAGPAWRVIEEGNKSEIRISKSETNSNFQMTKSCSYACSLFLSFDIRPLDIVSHFGFRASNLTAAGFNKKSVQRTDFW